MATIVKVNSKEFVKYTKFTTTRGLGRPIKKFKKATFLGHYDRLLKDRHTQNTWVVFRKNRYGEVIEPVLYSEKLSRDNVRCLYTQQFYEGSFVNTRARRLKNYKF